jgi:hypothetical protein
MKNTDALLCTFWGIMATTLIHEAVDLGILMKSFYDMRLTVALAITIVFKLI